MSEQDESEQDESKTEAVVRSADSPGASVKASLYGLAIGLAVFVVLFLLPPPDEMSPEAWRVAAVAILMAIFWVTEAVPLPVTALIPLAAFPLLGVMPIKATAAPYANPVIFLFMGGFIIALAMERWWVANTATTLMMLPIALSIVALYKDRNNSPAESMRSGPTAFPSALLLSVAYGATAGGMATLVGTPPNAFLAAFMLQDYGIEIGFAQWMVMALPLSIVMLVIIWWLITRVIFDLKGRTITGAQDLIRERAAGQGKMSPGEKRIAVLFALLALAWVARPWIVRQIPGLGLNDTVIAVTAAILAFMIPVDLRRGVFLMNWDWAKRLPFGLLILFGGGLSLASAISQTGLAGWIGTQLDVLGGLPPVLIVMATITLLIFLTELTSNTATTAAFLPVVAALAISLGENPMLLVAPAALAASCAFMLPVATPPNAIVYSSGHLTIAQMARAGLLLNVMAIVVITLVAYSALLVVFGVQPGVLPDWIGAAAGK